MFAKVFTNNLVQRTATALVVAPLVVGAVWVGGIAFDALVIAALLVGFVEWIHLTNDTARPRVKLLSIAGVTAILTVGMALGPIPGFALSLVVWLAVLLAAGRLPGDDRKIHYGRALWLAAGVPYLAWPGLALISLRAEPEKGLWAALYVLLVVWATDIGGYAVGCTVRGPKICPQISPKKTWSGLIGGMALAGVIGYGVAFLSGGTRFCVPILVAMALAVVAQVGDFFESHMKRRAGVKDSGCLFPGHGGVLDRIDGLLFAAPGYALVSCVLEVL